MNRKDALLKVIAHFTDLRCEQVRDMFPDDWNTPNLEEDLGKIVRGWSSHDGSTVGKPWC